MEKDKTLYVCGPPMMMEAIRLFAVKHNIKCYLALETIMACGIGICQGCSVEKNTTDDELIKVISLHSGKTSHGVKEQLEELLNSASDRTKNLAENLEPLEQQLEDLLDELNTTLRPRIEKPIRQKPILAIGIAAGIGILFGLLLSGGKRS